MRGSQRHTASQGVELSRRPGAARGTAIVRAGHPALDLALAAEATRHHAAPTLAAMNVARGAIAPGGPVAEANARQRGRQVTATSITCDRRTGATTTVHVATVTLLPRPAGGTLELTVWHELAAQSWN